MAEKVKATRVLNLPAFNGEFAQSLAILADGALAILTADRDVLKDWRTKRGNVLNASKSATARIYIFDGVTLQEGPKFPLLSPFLKIDRFTDGRWLVVAPRSDGEPNARIFSANSKLENQIMLGDGIEHVKIDGAGRIWVGWFDEGVFGNGFWQYRDRQWPPSSGGLGCFDDKGKLLWADEQGDIADCYALNVIGKNAWACTYTDFPIRRADGHNAANLWPTKLSGTRAIAVRNDLIVAIGGYQKQHNDFVVLRQLQGELSEHRHGKIDILPNNSAPILFDGRGEDFHYVNEGVWHRWKIRDFL